MTSQPDFDQVCATGQGGASDLLQIPYTVLTTEIPLYNLKDYIDMSGP
jgi:hypothetical protein